METKYRCSVPQICRYFETTRQQKINVKQGCVKNNFIKSGTGQQRNKHRVYPNSGRYLPARSQQGKNYTYHERMVRSSSRTSLKSGRRGAFCEEHRNFRGASIVYGATIPPFATTDLSHADDYTTPDTGTYPVTRYPLSFLISSSPLSFLRLYLSATLYGVIKFFLPTITKSVDRSFVFGTSRFCTGHRVHSDGSPQENRNCTVHRIVRPPKHGLLAILHRYYCKLQSYPSLFRNASPPTILI